MNTIKQKTVAEANVELLVVGETMQEKWQNELVNLRHCLNGNGAEKEIFTLLQVAMNQLELVGWTINRAKLVAVDTLDREKLDKV